MKTTSTATCAKCGSPRVVPNARLVDRVNEYGLHGYGGVQLIVDRRPAAMVFKQSERATLQARVCGACGFVEIYASDADALFDAYQASLTETP